MRLGLRSSTIALPALALALIAAGCGKTGERGSAGGGPGRKLAPVAEQGAVSVTTRNTTRLGGSDAIADAAAVARAVYPGLTTATRPQAVALVDSGNWPAALAASSLAGAPIGAPILFSEGGSLPDITRQTIEAMHPVGSTGLGGAQVISIGGAAAPQGLVNRPVAAGEAAQTAAGIEQVLLAADGHHPPKAAIVLPSNAPPAMLMPAAGLAAESAVPILFASAAGVPAPTRSALAALGRPAIYVIDSDALGAAATGQLRALGTVTSVSAGAPPGATGEAEASDNAIAVARFTNGTFGWGVKEPGHGLVLANSSRPLDGPAAARLSATGDYGPLLLLESAAAIPPALATYLTNIQPAYTSAPQFQPVRGVYNHGWLIGDESAISAVTQAEIDALLQISPRRPSAEEASVAPAE